MSYWTILIDAHGNTTMASEAAAASPGLDETAVTVLRFAASDVGHASDIYRELFRISDRAGRLEWRRQVMRSR